jgi:uncharacterized protein
MLAQLRAAGDRRESAGSGSTPLAVLRGLLVLLGLALVFYQIWSFATRPSTLTIAVGPPASSREAFVATLAKALAENATPHRVKLVPVNSSDEAAAYLDDDRVKLAVVRSDEARKFDARSIAIVDRRAVFLVARSDDRVGAGVSEEDTGDAGEKPILPGVFRPDRLLGKRIVVGIDDLGSNRALVARLLAHSGLAEPAIALTESPSASIAGLLAENKADVAALVLDVTEPSSRTLMAGISKALSGAIAIGGLPSPEALAALYRDITVTKVAAGIFGGLHLLPAHSVSTVAMTDELVGDSNLSDAVAAQLTKAILERRGRMLAENVSFEIESPPMDALRRYMPHAGVAAHLSERSTSFLETYSDQIWLGLFAIGLLGSSLAGLGHRLRLFAGNEPDSAAARIESLVDGIETATTTDEIVRLRNELRQLVNTQLKLAVSSKGASVESKLPANWFQTLDDLALRRAREISQS